MAASPEDRDRTGPNPSDSDPEAVAGADAGEEEDDESLIDEMRGSGVGAEDPNIVGRAHPGIVEEQVQDDQPPEV